MEIIIIVLLIVSILLFILSFFKVDRLTELEKTVEQLSLQHVQDLYQMKKKIRILEEELLIQDSMSFAPKEKGNSPIEKPVKVNEILQSQVLSLYQQGLSIDEISERSTLSHDDIMDVLQSSQLKGL